MIKNGMILAVALAALSAFGETVKTATQPWVRNYVATNTTSLAAATNYTNRALGDFAATGAVWRSASYGTTNRWTDATGCVWQVTRHVGEWTVTHSGVPSDEGINWYGPSWETKADEFYITDVPGWYIASSGLTTMLISEAPNLQEYVLEWNFNGTDVTTTCTRPIWNTTNLVGRVALTNDVTAEIRKQSLGGIWDSQLEVWWTPIMENGALRYCATTNINMEANQ